MNKLYDHVGPDNISEVLRGRRHSARLSVRDAAREAGVSPATLSRVENDGKPSLDSYLKLRAWIAGPSPVGKRVRIVEDE